MLSYRDVSTKDSSAECSWLARGSLSRCHSRSPIDSATAFSYRDVGVTALKPTRPLRLSSAPVSLPTCLVLPTPPDASTCLGTLPLLLARNERLLSRQSPRTVGTGGNDRGQGSVGHGHVLWNRIYGSCTFLRSVNCARIVLASWMY